jgi:hypothetical protein
LIGVDRSRAMAHHLAANALHALEGFDRRAEPLRALAGYAVERQL